MQKIFKKMFQLLYSDLEKKRKSLERNKAPVSKVTSMIVTESTEALSGVLPVYCTLPRAKPCFPLFKHAWPSSFSPMPTRIRFFYASLLDDAENFVPTILPILRGLSISLCKCPVFHDLYGLLRPLIVWKQCMEWFFSFYVSRFLISNLLHNVINSFKVATTFFRTWNHPSIDSNYGRSDTMNPIAKEGPFTVD